MIPTKICLTFAGVVGSSKTPIAHYLSGMLGLPVFNNDAIRTEVIEDVGRLDTGEYMKRRVERLTGILDRGMSFIADASVDREWGMIRSELLKHGYAFCVISINLSKAFLTQLYSLKGYDESFARIDQLLADHDEFVKRYPDDVCLHLTDADFPQRLALSLNTVTEWLKRAENQ